MTTSFGSLCLGQDRWYAAILLGGQEDSLVSVNPLATAARLSTISVIPIADISRIGEATVTIFWTNIAY